MMACCEFCGIQYLNEDGSIDWTILYPLHMENPVVLKEGEERYVCHYGCHVKGSNVLH